MLASMIEKLSVHTCTGAAILARDAGIATEENLHLIQSKEYS
jgi:hypothetical protein